MRFKLCYKDYEFKDTFKASLEFKRETGRCTWAVMLGVQNIVTRYADKTVDEMLQAIGEYIDKVDGALYLWVLAKQCNSTLKLSEIQDAVQRVGARPVDHDDLYGQPYTFVLYKLATDVSKAQKEEGKKAKKDLCHSEE